MNIEESNKLVVNNMRLLVSRVLKFQTKNYHDQEDIKSIGCLGLIRASRTWDESKSKFSTYAVKCIDNAIKTHLAKRKITKLITNKEFDLQIEAENNLELNECETLSDLVLKCKLFGLTTKKIAEKFNLTKSAVETLYRQGKQKAREDYA